MTEKKATYPQRLTRREFIKDAALTVTGLLIGGCSAGEYEKQPPPLFEISDLNENIESLKGEIVRTKGYPVFVGEESIWVPIVKPGFGTGIPTTISWVESQENIFKLYDKKDEESESLLMVKETMGLPSLPFSTAPIVEYDGEKLEVTGRVVNGKIKDGEKNTYFLRIHSVKETSTEEPATPSE